MWEDESGEWEWERCEMDFKRYACKIERIGWHASTDL